MRTTWSVYLELGKWEANSTSSRSGRLSSNIIPPMWLVSKEKCLRNRSISCRTIYSVEAKETPISQWSKCWLRKLLPLSYMPIERRWNLCRFRKLTLISWCTRVQWKESVETITRMKLKTVCTLCSPMTAKSTSKWKTVWKWIWDWRLISRHSWLTRD